jgi:hypothetical protein
VQVWRVVAATAACIFSFRLGLSFGYGLECLPCVLDLESNMLHSLAIGSRFTYVIILSFNVKVIGGGFILWLGENIAIFSMVKRKHLFL